ncbi:MAG: tripartite tricarboxylate transporter permease [Synergistaceae bacterium]|nr:tripartite tricarboxylate transporter permease [Synergistaceae bacterium]
MLKTLKLPVTFGMGLLLPLCFVLKPETAFFMLLAIYLSGYYRKKSEWHRLKISGKGFYVRILPFFKFLKLIEYNPEKTKICLKGFCAFIAILLPIFIIYLLREIGKAQFLALSVLCVTSVICFQASNIQIYDYENKRKSRFLSLSLSVMSATIGLAIPTIGIDAGTGAQRYSMEISELYGGIDFIIVVLGVCCLGGILYKVNFKENIKKYNIKFELVSPFKLAEIFSVIAWGIPFSQASAIIVGMFALYGISCSEMLAILSVPFESPAPGTVNFTAIVFFPSLLVFSILLEKMKPATKRVQEKIKNVSKGSLSPAVLYPIFAVAAFVGAYSINYRLFDLFLLIAFGVLGFIMRLMNFPITPLIVCAAFGPRLEEAYRAPFSWSTLTVSFYLLSAAVLAVYVKKALEPDGDSRGGAGFDDVGDHKGQ